MSFCFGTPNLRVLKFLKLGLLQLWRPITSYAYLQLRWGRKECCSIHQELSKNMRHATCTWVTRGNSKLLMTKSQIGNLIPCPSFGHNLCFKYPNGSCEPILDIYVPRAFQWYNELLNPMSFVSYNCPLNIQKSIQILIPKVWAHLGVCEFIASHFPTLPRAWNETLRFHSWPTPLQALALVPSPNLGLRYYSCLCN
jgi:hypothetical protein